MSHYRDELTERRKKMVEKAFRMMDRDGSGQLNIQDLRKKLMYFMLFQFPFMTFQ